MGECFRNGRFIIHHGTSAVDLKPIGEINRDDDENCESEFESSDNSVTTTCRLFTRLKPHQEVEKSTFSNPNRGIGHRQNKPISFKNFG